MVKSEAHGGNPSLNQSKNHHGIVKPNNIDSPAISVKNLASFHNLKMPFVFFGRIYTFGGGG